MGYRRLVLIGNGFDLAHGLKTSYMDFLDWYMCQCFNEFVEKGVYEDCLIEIRRKYTGTYTRFNKTPHTIQDVKNLIRVNDKQNLNFKSGFFGQLVQKFDSGKWVDIECWYYQSLKRLFSNTSFLAENKERLINDLNRDFDFLIAKLATYFDYINRQLSQYKKLFDVPSRINLYHAFEWKKDDSILFVNFNYTDTLQQFDYANEKEILHIHGRVSDRERNPIIFGYGDESDPEYQKIEDSGNNNYLEHIKSFGYFKTNNYSNLLAFLDSEPYSVYIVGHSCGLSDRILLNEIFEHKNCQQIDIFFYKKEDGTDNFKQITQEISRHFKPQNKGLFRRRVLPQNEANYIPQNKS